MGLNRRVRTTSLLVCLMGSSAMVAGATGFSPAAAQEATTSFRFSIPSKPLAAAIADVGRVSGWRIAYTVTLPTGVRSRAIAGTMTPDQAVARLLVGTGLRYRVTGDRSLVIETADNAAAYDPRDGSILLDPVNVTSRRSPTGRGFKNTPDWVYEAPDSVSVISRDTLRGASARHNSELFIDVAGVGAADTPQNPGLSVNIRGLQDQGRVNMMIDGVRQNYQENGHSSNGKAYVDTAFVREVDVEKSTTSGVGGAASLGGQADFRTLMADDLIQSGKRWGAEADATTGTNAYTFHGNTKAAVRISDSFSVLAGFSHQKRGEYDMGENGTVENYRGVEQVAAIFTDLEAYSGIGKAEIDFTDDLKLTATYLGYRSEFATSEGAFYDYDVVTNHTASAKLEWNPDREAIDFEGKFWFNRTNNEQYRPPRTYYGAFDVDRTIDTLGADVQNTSRFSVSAFDVALNYGAEGFRDKTVTNSVGTDSTDDPAGYWFRGADPNGERTVLSGFGNATVEYGGWLTVTGGLRYDHFDISGETAVFNTLTQVLEPTSIDRSDGRWVPSVGVAIEPFEGVQLFTKYSEGYRPPSIMETLLGGLHVGDVLLYLPNADLRPETSKTWEFGVNLAQNGMFFENDAFRAKAVYFHRDVNNMIANVYDYADTSGMGVPRLFSTYANMNGTSIFDGVEIEASYDAGRAYVGFSYSYLSSNYSTEYTSYFGPGLTVFSLFPGLPESKFTLDAGMRFFDQKLTLGGRMTKVAGSEYAGDIAYQAVLQDYMTFDLYGSYEFNDNATLRFNVKNVTDVAYVGALGQSIYPAPGRTATMSFNLKF